MSTLKRYSLYTFNESKLIWTDTENLKQALDNFKNKNNIDHNGTYHSNMNYVMDPMHVITVDKALDGGLISGEKILAFNCNKLRGLLCS